jgi:hypothetical protein
MANAIPVNSKPAKVKEVGPEIIVHESSPADVLARANEILAAEVPTVKDEQVNQIGQATSYGKAQKIMEIAYPEMTLDGKPTGKFNTCLRVDH